MIAATALKGMPHLICRSFYCVKIRMHGMGMPEKEAKINGFDLRSKITDSGGANKRTCKPHFASI